MDIILIFPGFIIAVLVVLLYECEIAKTLKEPRNKVRFVVDKDNIELYLRMNYREYDTFICNGSLFRHYGLKSDDFADMKEGEVREVFLDREYQA